MPRGGSGRSWRDSRGYQHFEGRGGSFFSGQPAPQVWLRRLAVPGVVGYVYYSNRQEIPYSHRKHLVLVSPATAQELGKRAFHELLAKFRGKVYPDNHPKTQLIRRIGLRLASTAAAGSGGGFYQHMKDCEWEFKVVHSPQINAMVAPGGKVIVFSGLLDLLKREDEVAFVLAHEISHELARHTAENLTTATLGAIVDMFCYWAFGFHITYGLVLGMQLPYSRRAEMEADSVGLRIMAESCFDPRVAPGVHQKFSQLAKGSDAVPTILSTHPSSKQRVAALAAAVPDAL